MKTTYELIIYGKVQNVGFRDRIESIGRGLGISGVIYNYKDGTVRILVNFSSERKKQLFKEFIKDLEDEDNLIKIEKIEERELNTYIEFPEGISRLSSDDILELNKKLDDGVRYIKLIFGELEGHTKILLEIKDTQLKIVEKLGRLDEKLDIHTKILENQSKLLERMDKKLNMHTKILENQNKLLEKMDKTLEMNTKILERMDKKLDNLEKGQNNMIKVLNEIKDALKK
jgi:acylphosphatase